MLIGVVCVGLNNEIGYKNKCCFNISEDRKFFKELIKNQIIVVGRITYETLPKSVLKQCKHVHILTQDNPILPEYISSDYPVYVIGGAKTYKSLESVTSEYYVTRVYDKSVADSFFSVDLRVYKHADIIKNGNNFVITRFSK